MLPIKAQESRNKPIHRQATYRQQKKRLKNSKTFSTWHLGTGSCQSRRLESAEMSRVLSSTSLAVGCNVCLVDFVPIKRAPNDNEFVKLACLPDSVCWKMDIVNTGG